MLAEDEGRLRLELEPDAGAGDVTVDLAEDPRHARVPGAGCQVLPPDDRGREAGLAPRAGKLFSAWIGRWSASSAIHSRSHPSSQMEQSGSTVIAGSSVPRP